MSNATPVTPSKAKTWVGLAGSLLAMVVPLALEVSDSLPAPWPVVIGAVVAVLTALGVYRAPYTPSGTVVVPDAAVTPAPATPAAATPDNPVTPYKPTSRYRNPWRR